MKPSKHIIDVREPHEFTEGHVENAINIPVGQLQQLPSLHLGIEPTDEVILYCRSGGRAGMACQVLANLGYTSVTNGINQATVEAQYLDRP
ncbi:MAG: phage shock protein [Patescibacteria group bacterium]|nr:phage shock protein [Patescibacteria group bacterium]